MSVSLNLCPLTSKLLILRVNSDFLFFASPPKWWPNLAARFISRAAFSGSLSSSSGTNTLLRKKCTLFSHTLDTSLLISPHSNQITNTTYFLPLFLTFFAFFWNLFGVWAFPSFLLALPFPLPLWFLPLPRGVLTLPLKLIKEEVLLELVEELLSLLDGFQKNEKINSWNKTMNKYYPCQRSVFEWSVPAVSSPAGAVPPVFLSPWWPWPWPGWGTVTVTGDRPWPSVGRYTVSTVQAFYWSFGGGYPAPPSSSTSPPSIPPAGFSNCLLWLFQVFNTERRWHIT